MSAAESELEAFLAGLDDDDIVYSAVFYVTENEAGMSGFGGFEDDEQRTACIESLRALADQLEQGINFNVSGRSLQ